MEKWNKKKYLLTIVGTILCLSVMITFNHFIYYNSIMTKMQNQGMGVLSTAKETIENSLTKDIDVVQLTAFSLEHMIQSNASTEEIESFLAYETKRYQEEADSNFAGIYGIVNGKFMDGSGWTPNAAYVPEEREWYIKAKENPNETVLISPYPDAKTNSMKMSVTRMLSDNENVIAIDINLNEVQGIINNVSLNASGYTFIVDGNGMVISHSDASENGKNYLEDPKISETLGIVVSQEQSYFKTVIDGKKYQICSTKMMEDWYVISVLDTDIYFEEVNITLVRNILLYGLVSCLILLIYIYSLRSVQHSLSLEHNANEKVQSTNMNLVRALVRTIDAKDRYTNGHSVRVAEYALKIAQRLGKSEEEQQTIYYAGLLHDVGKIRIPGEIINKPGKLTDEEYDQIKIHPVTGYHILKDIYDDKTISMGVKFHHERYDGRGYPSGLAGENIPEIARILAVADTYDAMASNRSYRKALPQEKVREEIEKGKGTQFDPEIADIMLEMIDEDHTYYLKEVASTQKTLLVVDDEQMSIKLIKHHMQNEPAYRIVSANSGEEALKLLDEMTVHLILLDVEMPEMDGYKVLAKIREKHNIPVVFITGNKDIDTVRRIAELGVEDYISKPCSPLMLKEIIHSILNE